MCLVFRMTSYLSSRLMTFSRSIISSVDATRSTSSSNNCTWSFVLFCRSLERSYFICTSRLTDHVTVITGCIPRLFCLSNLEAKRRTRKELVCVFPRTDWCVCVSQDRCNWCANFLFKRLELGLCSSGGQLLSMSSLDRHIFPVLSLLIFFSKL